MKPSFCIPRAAMRCRPSVTSYGARVSKRPNSTSVNNDEVDKFSAIGKKWWDKGSTSGAGPLHGMNAARVKFIHSCIGNHKKVGKQLSGLRILDVGCGGGLLAESLSRLGAEVTAIDPSKENITVASEHSSVDPLTATITYRQTTIEDVCAAGEKFDAVTCLEVIEHVDSPLRFMQNVCGVLDTGGSAFFSTMNRNPKSYALTIVAAEYILGMLPPGTHEWNKYITPEEMKVMLNSSGVDMTPSNWRGLVFNVHPIRGIEWSLSESDLEVNYIMHAKKR